jgi:hypothetical protein
MGSQAGDGTRAHPFPTIQAGIDFAKSSKRRVYVCAESYAEAITVADGISIFGNLSCAGTWSVSTKRALVKAPASPAVTAKMITSPTRIEGVEIVAPDTMVPSASSIAFVAIGSPGLRLVGDAIKSGNAGAGAKGDNAGTLTDAGSAKDGGNAYGDITCNTMAFSCIGGPSTAGGTNQCMGAKTFTPGVGGPGGNPGGQQSKFNSLVWAWATIQQTGYPNGSDGTGGPIGMDGAPGAEVGSIDPDKLYVASNGTAGSDGGPGGGGLGGAGYLTAAPDPSTHQGWFHWGIAGGGAGAGGCPGLAAGEGKGGGASIGLLAFDSPLAIESTTIDANMGGAGGASGDPSQPMSGGTGGSGLSGALHGGNGGQGGRAGVSGNGGGGPSIGIASKGSAPTKDAASTVTPGMGGGGVSARSVGIYSIPASPIGKSAATYAF